MEGKLNFILIFIIAVLSMAVAFIVIYLVITGGAAKPITPGKETTAAQQKGKVEINMEGAVAVEVPEMIINLKSGGQAEKALIKVTIGIMTEDTKFSEEVKSREMEIKDIIRSTFNSKTVDEVVDNKIDLVAQELLKKFKALYKEPEKQKKVLKVIIPSAFVQVQ